MVTKKISISMFCILFTMILILSSNQAVMASQDNNLIESSAITPEDNSARNINTVDLRCPYRTADIQAHIGTIRWTYYDPITYTLHYLMECSGGPGKNGEYIPHTYITWDVY